LKLRGKNIAFPLYIFKHHNALTFDYSIVSNKHAVEIKRQLLVDKLLARLDRHGDITDVLRRVTSDALTAIQEAS
jgi:hypothetical protein